MPDRPDELIASLHLTILTPSTRRVSHLFLATLSPSYWRGGVPELGAVVDELFPSLQAPFIDFERFRNLLDAVNRADVWKRVEEEPHPLLRLYPHYLPPFIRWMEAVREVRETLGKLKEIPSFAQAAIRNLVAPPLYPSPQLFLSVGRFRSVAWPFPSPKSLVLIGLYWHVVEGSIKLDVEADELAAWVTVAEKLIRPVSRIVVKVSDEYMRYEVPYSLSPKLNSASLANILQLGRQIIYAPLLPAAVKAGEAVTQGDWVLAVKVAFAGFGPVVILAAAVGLAEMLLGLPERVRRKRRS